MRTIKYIVVHCTAGSQSQSIKDLLEEFRRQGWTRPGYHFVIHPEGHFTQLLGVEKPSNGVKGFNAESIHVAYIGGIDAKGKAVDNRTEAQRRGLRALLTELKRQFPTATIQGHRDFSPDKNGNCTIEPWERIKECPCFNAKDEYKNL